MGATPPELTPGGPKSTFLSRHVPDRGRWVLSHWLVVTETKSVIYCECWCIVVPLGCRGTLKCPTSVTTRCHVLMPVETLGESHYAPLDTTYTYLWVPLLLPTVTMILQTRTCWQGWCRGLPWRVGAWKVDSGHHLCPERSAVYLYLASVLSRISINVNYVFVSGNVVCCVRAQWRTETSSQRVFEDIPGWNG